MFWYFSIITDLSPFTVIAFASSEIVWLVGLLVELGITIPTPIPLNADNTSAVLMAQNPILHERVKHIEVDAHFVWEKHPENLLSLHHVSSTNQIADVFTKAMSRDRHQFLISKLMLVNSHQFRGECEGT